jgi:putative aldouronate transport system substrate-binding protein
MAVVDGRKTMGDVTTVYGSSAERIIRYENGDIDSNTFLQARAFGRQSAGSVMKELRDLGKLLPNTYYGPTTQGMANNLATLRDLQNEMILQVITGHKDISAFDAFVQDWHKLGGEQITQEVNDWYQSAKSK